MTTATLLASAGSLDGIRGAISDFYCGTPMTLVAVLADTWKIVRTSDGKEMAGCRVIRKARRFRFEMV